MRKLRRFIWYLAGRLLLITVLLGLFTVTFYYAMNASNIYIVLKDGMAKRAQVIMMGESPSELTKFFQGSYLQRDENLLLAIDGRSPYSYYTIRGIDHRLEMTWMWCWPWESTARVEFIETIPRIDGRVNGDYAEAARALYGERLRADDYRRLMGCRTMTELAAALKEHPVYADALADVNPQYARRAQLESLLRQSLYTRYDSLCRYDRSAGSKVYEYFTLCCEVDELTAAMRCLDAGRPGDYLFRLPEFMQQRCCIDLYALAKATGLDGILAAVAGTPWEKVLAPLRNARADRGLTAQAEPLLQDCRHKALVALAPAGHGPAAEPGLRELIELECDTSAVSNAARLIRIGAPDSAVRSAARPVVASMPRLVTAAESARISVSLIPAFVPAPAVAWAISVIFFSVVLKLLPKATMLLPRLA